MKKFIVIFLTIAVAISVAACTRNQRVKEKTVKQADTEPTSYEFYSNPEEEIVPIDPDDTVPYAPSTDASDSTTKKDESSTKKNSGSGSKENGSDSSDKGSKDKGETTEATTETTSSDSFTTPIIPIG